MAWGFQKAHINTLHHPATGAAVSVMAQCEELIVSQLLRLDKIRRSKHRASLENAFAKLAIAEAKAAADAAAARSHRPRLALVPPPLSWRRCC